MQNGVAVPNWDDLRVFLSVARAESLSAAAPGLKMDPATLSRRISRLEDSLGSALFVKSPKGYALTDLGSRLLERASQAEETFRLAFDEGQMPDQGLTGQIRIGATDGIASYALAQAAARIQKDNPALEIQILALPRGINLSRREADMAVAVSQPQAGRLTVQKITDYHLHLVAHKEVAHEIRSLDDLKGRPIVGYIPDMIFDKELDYLGELGAGGVQLASNSITVQSMMLHAGGGVGFMHDFILPANPNLRMVLQNEVALKRTYYLIRHIADRRSERLNRFAERFSYEIRAEIAQLEAAAKLMC